MISFSQWRGGRTEEGTRVVQLKEERKKEGGGGGGGRTLLCMNSFRTLSVDIDDTPCTAQD